MPVWLLMIIAVGAVSISSVASYFITSARAKKNLAQFKEKVLGMIAILKSRIETLERNKQAAESERNAAEARARAAERQASESRKQAHVYRAAAEQERQRADRLEQILREQEDQIAMLTAELSRWTAEANAADSLERLAGAEISLKAIADLQDTIAKSPLLSGHKFRPAGVLKAIDESSKQAEAARTTEEAFSIFLITTLLSSS